MSSWGPRKSSRAGTGSITSSYAERDPASVRQGTRSEGPLDERGAVGNAQLLENVQQMRLHGSQRQVERLRELRVGMTRAHELHDLHFPARQAIHARQGLAPADRRPLQRLAEIQLNVTVEALERVMLTPGRVFHAAGP